MTNIEVKIPKMKQLWYDLTHLSRSMYWLMAGFLSITLLTFFFGFGLDENNEWYFAGPQDLGPGNPFMGGSLNLGAWWLLRSMGLIGALLIIPANVLWINGKRTAYLLAIPQSLGFLCQYVADGLNLNFLLQLTVIIPFMLYGLISWSDDTIKVKKVGSWVIIGSLILAGVMFGVWYGVDVLINNGLTQLDTQRGLDIATNVTTIIGYILLVRKERFATAYFTANDTMMFMMFTPLTGIGWSSLHMNISFTFFLVTKYFDFKYWWHLLPTVAPSRPNFNFLNRG